MLISCPKCSAVYQVPDNQIPVNGKKFKCAECGEIWFVRPQETQKETPVAIKTQVAAPRIDKEDDVEKMFHRLSQDTKGLFSEKDTSETRWARFKRKTLLFFSPFMINCSILLVIFAFTFFIGYVNRYELVSMLPQLENFYNKMGIESIYKGRGLVFQNVTTRNIERHGRGYVEVSGRIFNESSMTSILLPVRAVLLNSDGSVEAEAVKTLTLDKLESGFNALFHILLPNDTLEEKKVSLMFDEKALPQSANKARKTSNKE